MKEMITTLLIAASAILGEIPIALGQETPPIPMDSGPSAGKVTPEQQQMCREASSVYFGALLTVSIPPPQAKAMFDQMVVRCLGKYGAGEDGVGLVVKTTFGIVDEFNAFVALYTRCAYEVGYDTGGKTMKDKLIKKISDKKELTIDDLIMECVTARQNAKKK